MPIYFYINYIQKTLHTVARYVLYVMERSNEAHHAHPGSNMYIIEIIYWNFTGIRSIIKLMRNMLIE